MPSKVFFTDFHCHNTNRLAKLEKLIKKAGIDTIDFKNKFVAVKIHFGEWGNMAFLRQQYAKVVCDHIKARGGMPFLTDCNTLYPGSRKDALCHLDNAYWNGFSPLSTGVHVLIADGLRGTEERLIPLEDCEYVKEAKIGSAIADADIIVSLTHAKGHCTTGFGGVLKNLGMGCGSKHGKMEMHTDGTPLVHTEKCIGCGNCVKNCANDGVHIINGKAVIDEDHCLGCGHCFAFCLGDALDVKWADGREKINKKIAEYSKAVIQGKPSFHIAFLCDVSPHCDCDPINDIPLIPDVGIFAGFDPVAIDRACIDMANKQPIVQNSILGKQDQQKINDLFGIANPGTDWEVGLTHAEKIGVGSNQYELIVMK